MRDIVFAMELRGRAAPVEGSPNTLTAKTGGRGPHGETVAFESRVVLSGETFNETGSIDYSGYGKVTFDTVGTGHLGPSRIPGLQRGPSSSALLQGKECWRGQQAISPRILPSPLRLTS